MTGDMENGISINVARNCLPRKENFVRTHAADSPNNVFTASAKTVAINVTLRAFATYSVDIAFI